MREDRPARRQPHSTHPNPEPQPSYSLEPRAADLKGPHRYGLLKDAFRNRMVFVYGTGGTPEERGWAFVKARYDAEVFWYRGNGSVDVIADVVFDVERDVDRNVILFGNADTNLAWGALIGGGPVEVRRGYVTVGDRRVEGDALRLWDQRRHGLWEDRRRRAARRRR